MSYAVELKDEALTKLAGWNLSSRLQREVLSRLDRLGGSPARLLERLPAPTDCMVYQFTTRDPAEPSKDRLFSFSVVYGDDEETLFVFDCDLLVIDAETDPLSGP